MVAPATKSVTRLRVLRHGLRGRCPRCGAPLSFRSRFWINHACPVCGLRYQRGDGFYLGAVTWNYGLTVFGILPWVVLLAALGSISAQAALVLSILISIAGPILFYRYAWSLWLMVYYLVLIEELKDYPDESV